MCGLGQQVPFLLTLDLSFFVSVKRKNGLGLNKVALETLLVVTSCDSHIRCFPWESVLCGAFVKECFCLRVQVLVVRGGGSGQGRRERRWRRGPLKQSGPLRSCILDFRLSIPRGEGGWKEPAHRLLYARGERSSRLLPPEASTCVRLP